MFQNNFCQVTKRYHSVSQRCTLYFFSLIDLSRRLRTLLISNLKANTKNFVTEKLNNVGSSYGPINPGLHDKQLRMHNTKPTR